MHFFLSYVILYEEIHESNFLYFPRRTVFAFCASGLTRIGPIYRLTANKPIATKIPNQEIGLQKAGEKSFLTLET